MFIFLPIYFFENFTFSLMCWQPASMAISISFNLFNTQSHYTCSLFAFIYVIKLFTKSIFVSLVSLLHIKFCALCGNREGYSCWPCSTLWCVDVQRHINILWIMIFWHNVFRNILFVAINGFRPSILYKTWPEFLKERRFNGSFALWTNNVCMRVHCGLH